MPLENEDSRRVADHLALRVGSDAAAARNADAIGALWEAIDDVLTQYC